MGLFSRKGMGVDIEGVDAAWAHGQHAECYM
jgi:hypothetical protein